MAEPSSSQQPVPNPLPTVKSVIAIGAGKGGVGKSTVAALFAIELKRKGYIDYQRFTYYVDIAKLQKFKGDDDLGKLSI